MADRKRALILINKTAGMGKAGNDVMDIITRIGEKGYEPVVYPIIPGTDFTSEKLVADYDKKVDLILCSGGDGTLNHVVNAMMHMAKKPLLAYVPAGSTNDFAKGLGIPSAKAKAIEAAADGEPYTYDVGRMNDNYFNYVAAFGAFSKVSYATDQELKNVLGYAAYVISAIAELPQNMAYNCHMKIEIEDEVTEGDYIFGAVCNSASVGGMKLFGSADVKQDDGKMELILIKAPKNLAEMNMILTALAIGDVSSEFIVFRQVEKVIFHSDENTSWTMDGEFGGDARTTEIQVIHKAITIQTKRN
jgi:YegS/Rv2252/BmrU family lipid kinase